MGKKFNQFIYLTNQIITLNTLYEPYIDSKKRFNAKALKLRARIRRLLLELDALNLEIRKDLLK